MNCNGKSLISIALCTHNGENYLFDQLKSINEQTVTPFELVIGDDASTDRTVAIIKNFAVETDYPVLLKQNQKRLGVVENFSQTIARCRGRYVALCDQDDIWMPGKLENDLQLMLKTELNCPAESPILVHSDPAIFSKDKNNKASSYMKKRGIRHIDKTPLKRLLAQNFVTGCTAMVNRPLLNIALPIPPQAVMHDWWLALVAATCGKIVFNRTKQVLYRRHDNNLTGANALLSPYSISRIVTRRSVNLEYQAVLKQNRALLERFAETTVNLPPYIEHYQTAAEKGGIEALFTAFHLGIGKEGITRNLVHYFQLAGKAKQK